MNVRAFRALKAGGALLSLALIVSLASPLAYAERMRGGREHRDRDNNPPGLAGGPGTNWENRPGPQGGPGASPNYQGGAERRQQWAANHPEAAKRLDSNGDGKIDQNELSQANDAWRAKREERMKKMDSNGDGKLDPAERQAARKQWLTQHPEAAKKMDLNSDGKVDQADRQQFKAQRKERREDWRQKADANGDGKVAPQERRAMREKWLAEHPRNASQQNSDTPASTTAAPVDTAVPAAAINNTTTN